MKGHQHQMFILSIQITGRKKSRCLSWKFRPHRLQNLGSKILSLLLWVWGRVLSTIWARKQLNEVLRTVHTLHAYNFSCFKEYWLPFPNYVSFPKYFNNRVKHAHVMQSSLQSQLNGFWIEQCWSSTPALRWGFQEAATGSRPWSKTESLQSLP